MKETITQADTLKGIKSGMMDKNAVSLQGASF